MTVEFVLRATGPSNRSHIPAKIKHTNRIVTDYVNLMDMFPTFLEIGGVDIPNDITGRSIIPLLFSNKNGRIDKDRDMGFSMRERHADCREGMNGYPARVLVTDEYIYIKNFEPDRSPHGDLLLATNEGVHGDTDAGPTKWFLIENRNHNDFGYYYEKAFAKRPAHPSVPLRNWRT